ncbi:phosphoribosylamine--glycine ligase [Gephyromycinifex aptenodytis]|uniref:phosphoribosylamine--glycine ligase n=1 Tax=Gephyromycinifex aptenodytis TaxID=2716227 RepID=UPI00144733B8|nr:phosphoribosylamine--glycine ligase [Gephyromycinifex aptenodytis]
MKVLVLGSGAREHALVRALTQDPEVTEVLVAPGNPGMVDEATVLSSPGRIDDPEAMARLAHDNSVDLVVVGPEAPLVAGVADAVRARGIACFGPSQQAAALEGSKAFAKDVMAAAGVPTARARVCRSVEEAMEAFTEFGAPHVVKDDGLAAGKGVVVTSKLTQALAHAAQCLEREVAPGQAPPQIVVEEFLDGPEISLFCVTDGTSVLPLAPAQDYKRALDGGRGPNTGGMGAYSPLEWAPGDLTEQVIERIAKPTIQEMARRGTPFAGILYVGLALTARGLQVVEFNARFGDPETQVVLARLRTPLGGLLLAAANGTLAQHPPLQWSSEHAVTVVVAARGYPEGPRKGDPIEGITSAADAYVLHAGTAHAPGGGLVTAGGRVLSVVGTGPSLEQARRAAYEIVAKIDIPGAHHRSDIALAAAEGRVFLPNQENS